MLFSTRLLSTIAIGTLAASAAFGQAGSTPPAALPDSAAKQIYVPTGTDNAYDTVHYAPVLRAGNFVVVSGVAAAGPGEFEDQLRRMFERIRQNLAAAGATMDDVIELQSFHAGAPDSAAFQAQFRRVRLVHDEYFTQLYPAWTAIGNAVLLAPNALVEMRVTAIVGAGRDASVHREAPVQAAPAGRPVVSLPPAERIDVPAAGTTMAMRDDGGRPTVDVTINGRGPFRFGVDTGASLTVLSPDLIAELALPPASGAPSPGPVRIDEMKVGTTVLRGVTVGRIGILPTNGPEAARGVLSAAAFPGNLVILDFPAKALRIRPGSLPAADGASIFEYGAAEILPVISVRVGGQDIRLHLDSGSPAGLILPTRYAAQLPLASAPVEVGRATTVAGEFPVLEATMNGSIVIGRYTIDPGRIQFSDLRAGPGPGLGTVGASLLKTFVVTLDVANRRIKLER